MASPPTPTPHRSVRAYLVWLVLATLLPGVVGALLLFVHQYQKSRAQFERNTMHTVRALVHTVESKLLQGQAIAQTLSTIDALDQGGAADLARVHRQAREAVLLAGENLNVVLRDRSGQQLVNTAVEFGIPLPRDHTPQIDRVFSTGTVSVSDVFTGALRGQPAASVDVPVRIGGEVRYVLSVGLWPGYFADVLTPKSVPDGATAAIFDRAGVIFGRNLNAERTIGLRVADTLDRARRGTREGIFEGVTQEGTEVLTFHARSELTGWGVAVGVPRASLNTALFESLALVAAGVAVLFATGLFLAWQIGGRLARSVHALQAPADALGKGEPAPPTGRVYVREAAEVAAAIDTACALLHERDQALAAKESELLDAHLLARFGTWHWDLASGAIATSSSIPAILGRDVPEFERQRGTLLPEESFERIARLARELERDGGSGRVQLEVTHADGRPLFIDVRCDSIRGPDGRVTALRGTFQDVTERVRAEEALRQADRRKNEFLAMLAHELRNPLAPITSGAQLLGQDNPDPARVRQIGAIIARQARHMAALVDDLMDVSRVTRGLVELERQRLDINEIVLEAAEQVQEIMRGKGHKLEVTTMREPVHVTGDRKRLVQVVGNLLHNSAKFTPEGGRVAVSVNADRANVWVRVIDTGIGMLASELERAFDLFVQGERSPERARGGLGIGLALVRSLVQLHGGSVQVHSAGPGQGTTFTVSLPRSTERGGDSPDVQAAGGAAAHPLKVMVVDDNADAAQVLAMFVGAQGHEVAVEFSSSAALGRAHAFEPDVCLLDIGLPGMDGLELARRLRADPATAQALLVAVTGYGQEQDRRASAAAGFDHHLVKPVDTSALSRILQQAGSAPAPADPMNA